MSSEVEGGLGFLHLSFIPETTCDISHLSDSERLKIKGYGQIGKRHKTSDFQVCSFNEVVRRSAKSPHTRCDWLPKREKGGVEQRQKDFKYPKKQWEVLNIPSWPRLNYFGASSSVLSLYRKFD